MSAPFIICLVYDQYFVGLLNEMQFVRLNLDAHHTNLLVHLTLLTWENGLPGRIVLWPVGGEAFDLNLMLSLYVN